ncbi:hypothetical protein Tco_0972131 [Tanacetum coccineum]
MLLCCEPAMAYGLHLIRRISDESALVVKIDFTWSLGFGSVEPGRPPIPLSLILPMSVFDQDTKNFRCYVGRILALLLYTVLQIDRESWEKSQMELYMQNREHGRMILESVENGPLIWPTVEENGVTRTKKYAELSVAEKIQAACDINATISFFKQERECKLYDAFDKFTHIKGKTLHKYYLIFTQPINDMNIYNMKIEQFQVNTKFLNSLPLEWSKFVTDVKLVMYLHATNFYQLHAYLEQHMKMNFDVPVFSPGDDPNACLNKAMAFLIVVASSRVTVQQVQRRQGQSYSGTGYESNATSSRGKTCQRTGKTEGSNTYDSVCDDISNAKEVLMANISNYGSDVIFKVPHSETYLNDMENQGVQTIQDFEQPPAVDFTDNEIHRTMAGVDVDTLTDGVINLAMEDTFFGNKDEDTHDHIDQVLNIVGLFNIPEVSKDAVMLQVFPFTLTESAKQWVDRLAPGTINTWDLLKKAFIQRPGNGTYPWDETSPSSHSNSDMAGHSQKWHDGTTSRNIKSSSSNDGLASLANKLDNLGRDMKKLKESVHAIQVGCQICEGPRLDRDYPVSKEVKQVKEAWDARDALGYILDCTLKDLASDEELEELMKDQPLSADASPTALSPGYIADSNPEEDKEDPEEDPADHPADG